MAKTATKKASGKRSPQVGRPALVNAQDIITAAIDIGLEGVTLKQVADRLGVAVATLYRHVRDRDELVSLAAFRLALTRKLPETGDGHWTELAREYARSLFDSLVAEPQLIHEVMKGRLGADIELDFLDQFLAALSRHGIGADEGVRLHRAIAMLTIGAAVGAIALSAGRNGRRTTAMQRALDKRGVNELLHVRRGLETYLDTDPMQWQSALNDLLAGFEAAQSDVDGQPKTHTEPRNEQRRSHAS